jgi:hypothetical protein
MERKRWVEAEAAFDEAVVAWPFDDAILHDRASFLAAHSQEHPRLGPRVAPCGTHFDPSVLFESLSTFAVP